jgi:hypothetical protein
MDPETVLPKRLVNYIHDMGVRALDHLADNDKPENGPNAVHTLVDHWKSMSTTDKQQFVDRVATSVVEVVAASAVLPVGLKRGKKAAKSARKAIKRRSKALKKDAKQLAKGNGKAAKKKTKKATSAVKAA